MCISCLVDDDAVDPRVRDPSLRLKKCVCVCVLFVRVRAYLVLRSSCSVILVPDFTRIHSMFV